MALQAGTSHACGTGFPGLYHDRPQDAHDDPPRLGEATAQGYLLQWPFMPVTRQLVDSTKFNAKAVYPYGLRELDFQAAMQDVYWLEVGEGPTYSPNTSWKL